MQLYLTGVVENGITRAPTIPKDTSRALRLVRGESTVVILTVFYPDGTRASAADAVLTIKKSSEQRSVSTGQGLLVSGVVSTVQNNRTEFTITSAQLLTLQPGRYVYDIWLDRDPLRYRVVDLSELWLEPVAR